MACSVPLRGQAPGSGVSAGPRPFPAASTASRKVDPTPLSLLPIRPVWTLPLGVALTAPPAYDEQRVFFPLEGDRVAAYDLITGTQAWLASAASLFAPAVGEGFLFLAASDGLTALRAADGSVAWRVPVPDTLAVRPVWDNGWLVLSTTTGSTMALRGSDGHLIWRHDAGVAAAAPPALAGDRVYVSVTDGRVLAMRVDTGVLVWERRLGGTPGDLLALDDRIYVGSKDNFLYCLMASDGRVDWRWRTGGDIVGVPFVDQHRVFFVSFDNVLRALDRTSGGQAWLRTLPLRPAWGAVKAGGSIVVAGQSAGARAFNLKDGQPAGDLPAGAEVSATPHSLDDTAATLPAVLFVTRDIAKGAAAILMMRSLEPPLTPVAPLPNVITPAQTTLRLP